MLTTDEHDYYPAKKVTKVDKIGIGEIQQNRMSLEHLSRACDRFNVSDRAGAAIATGVLKDYAIITDTETRHVIDRSKLRRELTKHREVIRKEELVLFSLVDGVCMLTAGNMQSW